MEAPLLQIRNLSASIGEKKILSNLTLDIQRGETHVLMGPNGSGKSTFAHVLMGNPKFTVRKGAIDFKGKNILPLEPEERARLGMFLAFQYPREISGVQLDRFLFLAYNNLQKARNPNFQQISVFEFQKKITEELEKLRMNSELSSRSLNEGFSGGEKKKSEMLQLMVLEPEFAILDETDSGLDVDALKMVGDTINRFRTKNRGVLIVTHYQRLLRYVRPDFVHVMIHGKIVESGKAELADELEGSGYERFKILSVAER